MIKATDRKLVVGLEIGTAKVAALVGEVLPDGMVNIIGVGSCPSRGMDKGGVNDLESVVKCVQRAIDQAELMADCQISSVYLALSGKHISCQNEIGMVPISEEEVTQEDVENVVHTAKSVRVRDEHRVLHVIPQEYAIEPDAQCAVCAGRHRTNGQRQRSYRPRAAETTRLLPRAANKAASFTRLARSAPEKPGVPRAMIACWQSSLKLA
jgi:hypothetical protein